MVFNATGGSSAMSSEFGSAFFDQKASQFLGYHKNVVNVFLHMITTPVGLIGAVSLLRCLTASTSIATYFVLLYLLSLLPALTNGVYIGTALMCALIVYVTRSLKLSVVASASLIVLAYALQDLAHLGTGEKTFQSTYSNGGHVSPPFALSHAYFTL